RILDAYQIDKAVLLGMSMGAMLGQMIVHRHPERVKALGLYAGMYFGEGAETLPVFSAEVKAFFDHYGDYQPEGYRAQVDYAFKQWQVTHQSERYYNLNEVYAMIEKDVERAIDYNAKLNHAFAKVSTDVLSKPDTIHVPTLIIHGTVDNVIPIIHGECLAKTIPDVRFVKLEGAGHELHPNDYAVIVDSVKALLD
ncbi:MAG: alpha/beta hydrolase, partial [Bacilli bacterium]|nr:alpha/beta hydrolase [Bacilli bacterium]